MAPRDELLNFWRVRERDDYPLFAEPRRDEPAINWKAVLFLAGLIAGLIISKFC